MSERNTALGLRLRQLRKQRGLTSTEVASAVGTTQSHLCAIERGSSKNPRLDLLMKLAGFFGESLDELVGFTDSSDSKRMLAQITHWYDNQLTLQQRKSVYSYVENLSRD